MRLLTRFSFKTVCTDTLKSLRETFVLRARGDARDNLDAREFFRLSEEVQRALFTFESTSNQVVMRLYRRSDFQAPPPSSSSTSARASGASEESELLLQPGNQETVFLVYLYVLQIASDLTCI